MPVKLLTSGGGGVNLVPSSSIASDVTVTVPSKSGTTVLTDVADNIGIAATGANYITMSTNGSERMRIDSSGNLLVGTTTSRTGNQSISIEAVNSGIFFRQTGSGAFTQVIFARNTEGSATTAGSISTTGTTTSYVTTSDYRLKENVQPMTGALAKVAALKPVTYTWKSDSSAGEGFIAHELQAIVPNAVVGEKDEMRTEEYEVTPAVKDEEGNVITEAVMGEREVPVYQGIDQSKIVPLLTAALQEAVAKIESLTQRIEALEYTKQGE